METNKPSNDSVDSYRPPGRPGVTFSQVHWAADALLREGIRPTIEKVRSKVGGSPNNVSKLLDSWWQLLAKRIEMGSEVFERLPRSYAHLAESFFLQSMEEFRKLAKAESGAQSDAAAAMADETRLRSLLLDEREKELAEIIADRDNRIAALETALVERTSQLMTVNAELRTMARRVARTTAEIRRMHERLLVVQTRSRLRRVEHVHKSTQASKRRVSGHKAKSRRKGTRVRRHSPARSSA